MVDVYRDFLEGMIQFDICFQIGGKKQLEIFGFALNKSINSTHDLCCGPFDTLILSSCDGTVDFSTHFLVGCRLEEVELVSCLGYILVAPFLSITLFSSPKFDTPSNLLSRIWRCLEIRDPKIQWLCWGEFTCFWHLGRFTNWITK